MKIASIFLQTYVIPCAKSKKSSKSPTEDASFLKSGTFFSDFNPHLLCAYITPLLCETLLGGWRPEFFKYIFRVGHPQNVGKT